MKTTLTALLAICLCLSLGCGVEPTTDPNAGDDQPALPKPISEFEQTKANAEQGNAEAQYNLGWMYLKGEGVEQNLKEAVKWYRKAAEQGLAEAQCNLGLIYQNGEGVLEDDKEAVKWYRKAAEQGYAKAQWILGGMYAFGRGVPEDYVTAYAWLNIAAANGKADAKVSKGLLAKEMTADQIAEGQKLSREMTAKNPKLLK